MRKLKLLILVLLASNVHLLNIANADEPSVVKDESHSMSLRNVLDKIPALNQGVAYSLADSNFNYLTTIDLMSWKSLTLETGYSGRAKNTKDKLVIVGSIKLLDLKNVIKMPILDQLEFRPGIWYGWGNLGNFNNAEGDWGLSATVINIKF